MRAVTLTLVVLALDQDMVGIRQQLQHKYRVPLAQLPFDEDFFFLQQMKERKAQDEKLKAQKRKGKGRTVGPNVKKKVNETLSDMNFSLTMAGATDGADVFTLKSEQDEVIELTSEKGHAMEMPKVPGRTASAPTPSSRVRLGRSLTHVVLHR
jgi:hypothetical protein